ncbi:hypothetical protein NKH77_00740 [Streptomyces sp. M19]
MPRSRASSATPPPTGSPRTRPERPRLRLADRHRTAQPAEHRDRPAAPATLAFDHPSPAAITRFVLSRHPADRPDAGAEVLTALDRLEAAMLRVAHDPAVTATDRVDARLRTLLARWGGARNGEPRPDAERDLGAATDGELFAFLDEQLESQDPEQ